MQGETHSQGDIPRSNDKGNTDSSQIEGLRKKTLIMKIVIACLAVGCVVLVIVVLAKSSSFFGYMFTLGGETTIKAYLRTHYTSLMALLYLSIFGLVITIADTILLFFKFTQKGKLLWFHLGYYLAFLICGCVALSNKDYKSYMSALNGHVITDPVCLAATFVLECLLAPNYFQYQKTVLIFFIIFNIFFVAYGALYHYTATILMPLETEVKKPEGVKESIFNANMNNETFVSQMLDEYA